MVVNEDGRAEANMVAAKEPNRERRMQGDALACFDRWAEEYDRSFLSRHIRAVQKEVVRTMRPAEDAIVLDVGCGTGEGIRYLARRVKRGFLAGLDLSPQMIEVARRKLPDQSRMDLKVGDAEQLPWPDSFFDQAMSTFTLHHCPHPDRALGEIQRVLKPGGCLFLVDLVFPKPLRRPLNWLLRLAEDAELEVQALDSMSRLFLQAPFHLISPRRLVPLIFLLVGQKQSPAAKERGTGIA